MNDLIEIGKSDFGGKTIQAVDARKLHEFLGSKQDFSTWIKDRIQQYGFTQDIDFVVFHNFVDDATAFGGKRRTIEYHLSLDMAKELSMVERNDRGKQARQYFIECERRAQSFAISLPQTYSEALRALADESEKTAKLQAQIEHDLPKTIFADAVSASRTSILVGELAKLLKQNGIDVGQNRLFERLRVDGYLIRRKGADWNMPTQKSMEMGLFEIKERTINSPDGSIKITRTTKISGKGQLYFINKFLSDASVRKAA